MLVFVEKRCDPYFRHNIFVLLELDSHVYSLDLLYIY